MKVEVLCTNVHNLKEWAYLASALWKNDKMRVKGFLPLKSNFFLDKFGNTLSTVGWRKQFGKFWGATVKVEFRQNGQENRHIASFIV